MKFTVTATFDAEARTVAEAEALWRLAHADCEKPAQLEVAAKRGVRIPMSDWTQILYLHREGTFTRADLRAEAGATVSATAEAFRDWERRGIIEVVDHVKTGRQGRPAPIYRYVPPEGGPARREKRPTPEQEAAAQARKRDTAPVRGAGKRRRLNKASDPILRAAERQGATVEYAGSGHVKVKVPGRPTPIIMASTPRREGRQKDLKRLREAGLDV